MSLPTAIAPLLAGKKGLIVGIANEHSIAWGCAAPSVRLAPTWPSRM